VSKSAIAKQLSWRSSNMVDHYNDLEQIVKSGHTTEICYLPLHHRLLPPLLRM